MLALVAHTAYVGLGSNLGDRLAFLRAACAGMAARTDVRVMATSPVFETDAVGTDPQPPYLNAVLRVETELAPSALLALCLAVERSLGRERPPGHVKAARIIDLDLLLYDDLVAHEPGLTVPHPEMLERPFVRVPLATVATAGLRHPVSGEALDGARPDPAVRPFTAVL